MDESLELQMQSNTHILQAKVRARFHFLAFYHKICQIPYYSLSFGACYLNYTQPTAITKPNTNLLKKTHGYSRNYEITADDASRHANVFLRHTANKGEQAPCCLVSCGDQGSRQTGSSGPPWAGEIHLYLRICNQPAPDSLTAFHPALTEQTCARGPSARPISAVDITGRNYSHKSKADLFGSISAKQLDGGPKNISNVIFKV